MKGVFVSANGYPADFIARVRSFDKVAVQDSLPDAKQLIVSVKAAGVRVGVWTASPDDTTRLMEYGAQEIIVQGEDNQADAVVLNVEALRTSGFKGLISVVTNLWPSRNMPWLDKLLHHNGVRLLVECYLPQNKNCTPTAMLAEAHRKGYPTAQPVIGCFWGADLAQYPDRGPDFWIWDVDQMPGDCW